jgi:SnoaL-like domain
MTDVPESFHHYLAAWNEPDPELIRAHLDRSVRDDVLFVDPVNTTTSIDELEAMIRAAREEMPTASYVLTSEIDGHHGRFRYRWEVRLDGAVLMPGMDVTTVDDDQLIGRIDGFFGDFVGSASPDSTS